MKATLFEFRFRILIALALYCIGFWAPWTRYGAAPPVTTAWLALSTSLARWGWLPLDQATLLVTVLAIACACAGAALRIWGAAWLGSSIVQSSAMHGARVMASGPYRFLRNPLYLGTCIFSFGVSILMPPAGALFFLIATLVFYYRLILREEDYLARQLGAPYLEYRARIPRRIPGLRPAPPGAVARPHWLQAILGELYVLGFALCFALLAWRYEPRILIRCLVICFGISVIARAFIPRDVTTGE